MTVDLWYPNNQNSFKIANSSDTIKLKAIWLFSPILLFTSSENTGDEHRENLWKTENLKSQKGKAEETWYITRYAFQLQEK